jgi:hypothetical protein
MAVEDNVHAKAQKREEIPLRLCALARHITGTKKKSGQEWPDTNRP